MKPIRFQHAGVKISTRAWMVIMMAPGLFVVAKSITESVDLT